MDRVGVEIHREVDRGADRLPDQACLLERLCAINSARCCTAGNSYCAGLENANDVQSGRGDRLGLCPRQAFPSVALRHEVATSEAIARSSQCVGGLG
jgi:hypothetical protein